MGKVISPRNKSKGRQVDSVARNIYFQSEEKNLSDKHRQPARQTDTDTNR